MNMTSRNKNMSARLKHSNRMNEPTIAAGFATAFIDFAVSRGADREILITRSDIGPDEIKEPDNRIPFANYITLMKTAIELCDEPALALHFGEAVRLQDISILGLVGHAETAEQAREQANRYGRLAVDDGNDSNSDRIEFVKEGENVWLKFTGRLFHEQPLLTESTIARCVCDGRAFETTYHERSWPRPKAIRFTYEEPSYRTEYDRIFAMPLYFKSDMNAILFPGELMSVRVAPPNAYVARLLDRQADALLQRLDGSNSIRGRVEELLLPTLHTGPSSMETIAEKIGVSRQTLFRKLKAEGVTFEQVLDELRYKLALHYLKGEKIPVNQTAYLVGFSDSASFSRAFKRWAGTSPRTIQTASN